jgi:hypothetical protein
VSTSFWNYFEHFSGWLDSLYLVDKCGVEAVSELDLCSISEQFAGFSGLPVCPYLWGQAGNSTD